MDPGAIPRGLRQHLGPAFISFSLGLTHMGSVSRQCGLFPLACPMGSLGEHDACHVSLPHAHNATLQDHTTASSCPPPGEPVRQCSWCRGKWNAEERLSKCWEVCSRCRRVGPSYLITLASATEIGTKSSSCDPILQ